MSEQFVLLSRRNRSSKLLAVAVVLAVLCTGCGGAFITELTVDLDQIEADPLFEMAPAGSELVKDTSYSGTSSDFRLRKTWGAVSDEAFHNSLQSAVQEHEVRFFDALCLESTPAEPELTRIRGNATSGDYPVSVVYTLRGDELTLEFGGPNDLTTLDPTRTTRPFEEILAEAPDLAGRGCSDERLAGLERMVR